MYACLLIVCDDLLPHGLQVKARSIFGGVFAISTVFAAFFKDMIGVAGVWGVEEKTLLIGLKLLKCLITLRCRLVFTDDDTTAAVRSKVLRNIINRPQGLGLFLF